MKILSISTLLISIFNLINFPFMTGAGEPHPTSIMEPLLRLVFALFFVISSIIWVIKVFNRSSAYKEIEKIRHLVAMKNKGLLTDDEFKKKKREALE